MELPVRCNTLPTGWRRKGIFVFSIKYILISPFFSIFNEQGQLIVARLSPKGYKEISRVRVIAPTVGTREERAATWAHPAYANKHLLVRSDKELLCVSLAAKP
jgi:hypothetical protein